MVEQKKLINLILIIAAIFTIIIQIFPPETSANQTATLLLFFGILFYVVIIYTAMNITEKVRSYLDKINWNKANIEKLNKKMETEKKFNEMDKRISNLEFLRGIKKGQIDPRWIFIAILFVLIYLYLRSLGIVP